MALRFRIFIRTVALLGVLLLVSTIAIVSFVIFQNRRYWDERCRQEIKFVSAQSDRLILWDDRIALQELLEDLVASMEQIDYAFVEREGVPYAHTFKGGVPPGILDKCRSTGEVELYSFKDEEGSVFHDYSIHNEFSGTAVHLGVSRYKIDRDAAGVISIILLAGSSLFLLSLLPGWIVSDAITREVSRANQELNRMNLELEMRVEKRTSELSEANKALTAEMSERKKLEKQRDDFLSMLRHDMRTPLSVIYGYAELLNKSLSDKESDDLAEMCRSIMTSSQKLARMVEDMTEMSRLESGSIRLEYGPVDLSGIASEACLEFSTIATAKGISLNNDVPEDMPRIMADDYYVKRALSNLVSNALNYTPRGGSVTITGGDKGEKDARTAFISVSDTGPGIPEEEQEKIFEKYYRCPSSKGTSGKGLGLAIVKAVMDAHSGRVELESEPGKGSTFTLAFPLSAPSGADTAA